MTQFSVAEDREHKGRRYEQKRPELLNSSRKRLLLGFGELDAQYSISMSRNKKQQVSETLFAQRKQIVAKEEKNVSVV